MERAAVLVLAVVLGAWASEAAARPPTDFIRSSCSATTYPQLCVQCLAAYAPVVRRSPRQLAQAALSVSTSHARSASAYVARLTAHGKSTRSHGGGAVQDCLETMGDSVDRLQQSMRQLRRMGRKGSPRFAWHLSNVQTWVSAAITNENTCLDSLKQDSSVAALRASIRAKVVDVARVTSNALALVNRIEPVN